MSSSGSILSGKVAQIDYTFPADKKIKAMSSNAVTAVYDKWQCESHCISNECNEDKVVAEQYVGSAVSSEDNNIYSRLFLYTISQK